jgi:hypothetical protein
MGKKRLGNNFFTASGKLNTLSGQIGHNRQPQLQRNDVWGNDSSVLIWYGRHRKNPLELDHAQVQEDGQRRSTSGGGQFCRRPKLDFARINLATAILA